MNDLPHRPADTATPRRLPDQGPITLRHAGESFLNELAHQAQLPKSTYYRSLLASLAQYLGPEAPLLAYTKLTGEAWRATLHAAEQPEAQTFLAEFREYLRTFGWFDAARPVNQFD